MGRATTRRRFLVAAITFSGLLSGGTGLTVLRSSSAWAKVPDPDAEESLARFARLLFPHEGIADNVFREVIRSILDAAAADSSLDGEIESAITSLDSAQEGDWFEAGEATQIAAMLAVQGAPFFAVIQMQVASRFYNHPQVQQAVGYPGSSKEHGGYVDRGFDDIDWLPEEA